MGEIKWEYSNSCVCSYEITIVGKAVQNITIDPNLTSFIFPVDGKIEIFFRSRNLAGYSSGKNI